VFVGVCVCVWVCVCVCVSCKDTVGKERRMVTDRLRKITLNELVHKTHKKINMNLL